MRFDLKLTVKFLPGETREISELFAQHQRQHRRGNLLHQRLGLLQQSRAPFRGAAIHVRGQFVHQKPGQRYRLIQQLLEILFAVLAHKTVRIFTLRQKQKPHLFAVGELAQTVFERTPRRAAAGVVAVKTIDNFVGLAQQLLHVHRRGGGAQGRYRIFNAVLRQRHHIQVTLDHDHPARITNCASGLIQAIKLAALFEQRRLRRIQVLGFARAQYATAKADDIAAHIDNRKHDAVTENIVAPALVILLDQPHGSKRARLIIRIRALQILPAVRCIAHAEFFGNVARQSAFLEVLNRLRRFFQRAPKKLRGDEHDFVQVFAIFTLGAPAIAVWLLATLFGHH